MASERDDSRGGRDQYIIVEIRRKGQRVGSARMLRATLQNCRERKVEDKGHPRANCEQNDQWCARYPLESEPGADAHHQ